MKMDGRPHTVLKCIDISKNPLISKNIVTFNTLFSFQLLSYKIVDISKHQKIHFKI